MLRDASRGDFFFFYFLLLVLSPPMLHLVGRVGCFPTCLGILSYGFCPALWSFGHCLFDDPRYGLECHGSPCPLLFFASSFYYICLQQMLSHRDKYVTVYVLNYISNSSMISESDAVIKSSSLSTIHSIDGIYQFHIPPSSIQLT